MTNAKKIERYVKECFDELSINYREFFCYYDVEDENDKGTWIETSWQNEDDSVDLSAVRFASVILGIDEADILSVSEEAILNKLRRFPYYGLVKPFELAYKKTYYGKGFDEIHFLETLFGGKSNQPYPQRYNYAEIKARLLSELKELQTSIPNIYHDGCSIENLKITTQNFCVFDEIDKMVNSYIEMISLAKDLFVKAVSTELSKDEILDYNLLVSTFGIGDRYYTKGYLYYNELLKVKDFYKDITVDNFFDNIVFVKGKNFEPWKCSGFISDEDLVRRFLEVLPETKAAMGKFAIEVSKFLCLYQWSDSDVGDYSANDAIFMHNLCDDFDITEENRTALPKRFYIKKTTEEMKDDKDVADTLTKYARPYKLGGIEVKVPAPFSPEISIKHITSLLNKVESSNFLQRAIDKANNGSSLKGENNDE